jgi:hypothetical protein
VGGTIYNNYTLEPLKELGLDSHIYIYKFRNLLPSFMFILSITLPNLSIPDMPFPALFSISIGDGFRSSLQPS